MAALFDGKTVLITGACGGFGQAAAKRFAREGARLVLSDLDEARLRDLDESLACETTILAGDVAEPGMSRALVELAVTHFGGLHVALNNAGIAHRLKRLAEIDDDEAGRVVTVNLLAVFYAMKQQIPVMERQFAETGTGGAIVNLASVAGVVGAPGLSVYTAAKHGVVGLTKTAALESARRGVRINAICPSYAMTPMLTDTIMKGGDEALDPTKLARGIPMGRLAAVDEVVEAIVFAASPANGFMTGQTLHIDGGLTAA